jgi:MFS family permease
VEALLRLNRSRALPVAISACIALVYAAFILQSGERISSDTKTYSKWADSLLATRFNYREFLTTEHFVVPPALYLGWITVVAVSKLLLGSAWTKGIVFLNWLSAAALAYALTKANSRFTASTLVGIAATLLFTTSLDVLIFLPYVLSDVVFMGLSSAVLLIGLFLSSDTLFPGSWRLKMLFIGTAIVAVACVFRPTAAPLVAYWSAGVFLTFRKQLTAAQAWAMLAMLAVVAGVVIVGHAALMKDPATWTRAAQSGWIRLLSDESHKGIVVFGRPETYVAPPQEHLDFVKLTLAKLAYYFAPWVPGYSRFHVLAGAFFFLTVYALSLVALFRSPRWRLIWLLVIYVGAFSLFHGLQQIDYDHRYRLPILPALIVLSALGLEQLGPWVQRYVTPTVRVSPS